MNVGTKGKLLVAKMARSRLLAVLFIAIAGYGLLLVTKAATATSSIEPELATLSGCASNVDDSAASGGSFVQFGCPSSTYGAQLPISYDIGSLTGTVRYVAPNGNNSNNGSVNAPYATLAHAHSSVSSGGTIVMRGGVYRDLFNTSLSKGVKVIAYPGEVPELRGSVPVPSSGSSGSGWNNDGNHRWRSYQPVPLSDGSGINFSTGMQNLTGDGVGRYPDQVWIGDTTLKQVTAKSQLSDGSFWVDRDNNRLYLTAADAAKPGIEVSSRPPDSNPSTSSYRALNISGQNVWVEGIRIARYSNTPNSYGVITAQQGAHNLTLKNVEVMDSAFIAVMIDGGRNGTVYTNNPKLEQVTIDRSNWMGVSAVYTNDLTLSGVRISRSNQFDEFLYSPQSGALKGGRTWRTKIINSEISDNHSHGLWLDQSNYDAVIAGSRIVDNWGRGVYFEISDKLLLVNNFIRSGNSGQAVKLAGSSGLRLVNNTIIGGADTVGVYVDDRSKPGCVVPNTPNCAHFTSDWDTRRSPLPATMDWMPRIDLMINNIIAYPTTSSGSLCSSLVPLCITTYHGSSVNVALQDIIHKAEPGRGIPQTIIDGNVYANGSGSIIRVNNRSGGHNVYSNLQAFTQAMAGSPVGIGGIEANGKYGNSWVGSDGKPTSALIAAHNQAVPIPADAAINEYIIAGTRRYGSSL